MREVSIMEYHLGMCSTYDHHVIEEKDIYIFESHNMALPVWGVVSNKLGAGLHLVTFDSHTDTRNPFSRFMSSNGCPIGRDYMLNPYVHKYLANCHYRRNDFNFEDAWRISTSEIANDEHIQTAFDWGYLESYTVICSLDNEEAKCFQDEDIAIGLPACYISRDSWLLESSYTIAHLAHKPIALDFDLDYFRCQNDANDEFWSSIAPLVKQSSVITVAREPMYFNNVNAEPCFTNQIALDTLLNSIRKIMKT